MRVFIAVGSSLLAAANVTMDVVEAKTRGGLPCDDVLPADR